MYGHLTRLVAAVCLAAGLLSAALAAGDCELPPTPWRLELLFPLLEPCNREVAAARIAVDAADADTRVAAQRPNPSLTLGVSNINPHAGIGSGDLLHKTVDASVRIDQTVERGGKARYRVETAAAARTAAVSDLDQVRREQQAALVQAWHAAVAADERLALLRELQRLGEESETLARKRVQAGDLPVNDLTRISLEVLRAANETRQAEAEARQARLDLMRLLGGGQPPEGLTLTPAWPSTDQPATGGPEDALPDNRPDLAALRARAESARAAVDLARAQAREDLSVGVQFDHWPTSAANAQGTGDSVALSLTVPLEIRHRHEGEIRRAEADYQAALDALESARRNARQDLSGLRAALEAARDRTRTLQERIIPAGRDIAARSELAYDKGAASVLDLIDSRRALRQVLLDGVDARLAFARTLADWQLASGRPLPPGNTASDTQPRTSPETR